MIKAENYNEIQKARKEKLKAEDKLLQVKYDLACACKRALQNGATLRDVSQILEVSRERVRKIATKAKL